MQFGGQSRIGVIFARDRIEIELDGLPDLLIESHGGGDAVGFGIVFLVDGATGSQERGEQDEREQGYALHFHYLNKESIGCYIIPYGSKEMEKYWEELRYILYLRRETGELGSNSLSAPLGSYPNFPTNQPITRTALPSNNK
jgi:hypothetical protein